MALNFSSENGKLANMIRDIEKGIETKRGKRWTATGVKNIVDRKKVKKLLLLA